MPVRLQNGTIINVPQAFLDRVSYDLGVSGQRARFTPQEMLTRKFQTPKQGFTTFGGLRPVADSIAKRYQGTGYVNELRPATTQAVKDYRKMFKRGAEKRQLGLTSSLRGERGVRYQHEKKGKNARSKGQAIGQAGRKVADLRKRKRKQERKVQSRLRQDMNMLMKQAGSRTTTNKPSRSTRPSNNIQRKKNLRKPTPRQTNRLNS